MTERYLTSSAWNDRFVRTAWVAVILLNSWRQCCPILRRLSAVNLLVNRAGPPSGPRPRAHWIRARRRPVGSESFHQRNANLEEGSYEQGLLSRCLLSKCGDETMSEGYTLTLMVLTPNGWCASSAPLSGHVLFLAFAGAARHARLLGWSEVAAETSPVFVPAFTVCAVVFLSFADFFLARSRCLASFRARSACLSRSRMVSIPSSSTSVGPTWVGMCTSLHLLHWDDIVNRSCTSTE